MTIKDKIEVTFLTTFSIKKFIILTIFLTIIRLTRIVIPNYRILGREYIGASKLF